MSDYTERVNALRCDLCTNIDDGYGCKMWYCTEVEPNVWKVGCRAKDAAAAIEALQAEVERLQADVDAAYAH